MDEGIFPNAANVFGRWSDVKWYNYCDSYDEFENLLSACYNYCTRFFREGVNIPEIIEIMDLHIKEIIPTDWFNTPPNKTKGLYMSNVCWAHNVPYDWEPGEYLVFPFDDEKDIEQFHNEVLNFGWELGGNDLLFGFDGSAMSSTMRCFIDETFLGDGLIDILSREFVSSVFKAAHNLFDIYKKQSA